jgi:hypothetical protein
VLLALGLLPLAACYRRQGADHCPWPPERQIPPLAGRSERTWTVTTNGGVIEGRVEDMATGTPLDVTVALVGTRAQGGGGTGPGGNFRFTNVPPGRHIVLVFGRYPDVRDTVVVGPNQGMRGRLRLEPSHTQIECVITVS